MTFKNYVGLKTLNLGFDGHLTVLYTGDLDSDRASAAEWLVEEWLLKHSIERFYAIPTEPDLFGPNNDIPVIIVQPSPAILDLREYLLSQGLPNPSEFPWTPHITIPFLSPKFGASTIELGKLGVY